MKKTHGESQTRLYKIWSNMRERCYNENGKEFHRYGGRGITVCNEWLNSFEAFRDWALSHEYAEDLTIDRINNDSGYSPENCQWVPRGYNSAKNFGKTYEEWKNGVSMANNYYPEAVKKYKAKAYKQIKVEYKREFVEAFEKKLKADGIKKAEFFRKAISDYLKAEEV